MDQPSANYWVPFLYIISLDDSRRVDMYPGEIDGGKVRAGAEHRVQAGPVWGMEETRLGERCARECVAVGRGDA